MTKELLDRYLKEAYRMGQVFWQQADSEFVSQHKKADVTKAKFDQLLIDAGEALAQQEHLPDSEYARGFADGQKEFAEIAGGEWQTAVVDQLVIHHVYQASHDTDPRKAVHDLLCISNDIALDPQVSSDAQALVDRGRGEAQQDQPDQQLCSFYQVDSFPALVAAQEQHIQKLQAKLAKPANPFHPLNSREG